MFEKPEAEEKLKRTLKKYTEKHKHQEGMWPKWYVPNEREAGGEPYAWPPEQPHPSTQEYDWRWNKSIAPLGPTGLPIDAALWHGIGIDDPLILRHKAGQSMDSMKVP